MAENCPYCDKNAVEEQFYCAKCGTIPASQTKRAIFLFGKRVCKNCTSDVESTHKKVCNDCGQTVEDNTLSVSEAVGKMTSKENEQFL
ncbi:MAG: hypothetical protein ABH829_02460 [archaeon]